LNLPVHAQHVFVAKLSPYQQSFNKLGAGNATFSNGTNPTTVPNIIAGCSYVERFVGLLSPVVANDCSSAGSAAYNFEGTNDTDRSLGHIAGGISSNSGVGYNCVRLPNRSNTTIKNPDTRYVIKQRYNSSLSSDAYFCASYRVYTDMTSFAVNDLVQNTGNSNWVAVSELDRQAPSMGGILRKADSNSTTYRCTTQHQVTNINLSYAAEIILRFRYSFDSQTNGNGGSSDDLAQYRETNALYSTPTGLLDSSMATLGQAASGSNRLAREVDFTAANCTYCVIGKTADSCLSSGTWRVSERNSRAVDSLLPTLMAGSADKDEAYRVRAVDQVYTTYFTSSPAFTASNQLRFPLRPDTNYVARTWFISHETAIPLLKLEWAVTRQGGFLMQTTTYIDHYTDPNQIWDEVSSSLGSFSDDGQPAVQRTGVTTFLPFSVTSKVPASLPIELVSFQAHHVAPRVRCTWTTPNERRNAYFLLDRGSNGIAFQSLDTVAGYNLHLSTHTYHCQGERPVFGLGNYHLRQVDSDGTTVFSPVVAVGVAPALTTTAISVNPNPSAGYFTLPTAFDTSTRLQEAVVATVGQELCSSSTN
jgi:hypothetical protein